MKYTASFVSDPESVHIIWIIQDQVKDLYDTESFFFFFFIQEKYYIIHDLGIL